MAPDVSMCHTQQFCGWDKAYKRSGPPGTIHVVGYLQALHRQKIEIEIYSAQTPIGSVETIHKNSWRKSGRHNSQISTQVNS